MIKYYYSYKNKIMYMRMSKCVCENYAYGKLIKKKLTSNSITI